MLNYGPTLSQEAYDEALVELYASNKSKKITQEILRQDMELTVDHRLGVFFPRERRNHLWLVQQKINAEYSRCGRVKLLFYWLVSFISAKYLTNKIERMTMFVIAELESVFTREELIAFAGDEEDPELH